MSVVKILMMQKNEGPFLARWLAHYSHIFGPHNLIIFDNGSTDPYSLALLNEAEYRGAFIERSFTQAKDFQHKGLHFTEMIHTLDQDSDYDFALPVDCDELLAVFTPSGLSIEKDRILAEFDRLKGQRSAFAITPSLFNVPLQPGWFSPNRHFPKGFVPAKCKAVIDDGQHFPASMEIEGRAPTYFTYLHFHNRPFEEMQAYSRAKLSLELDDVTNEEKLRDHERQSLPGGHMVHSLLLDKEGYQKRYDNEVQLYFEGSGILLRTGDNVRLWDAQRYLKRHPDTRAYGAGPLYHYLMHGAVEGRELP